MQQQRKPKHMSPLKDMILTMDFSETKLHKFYQNPNVSWIKWCIQSFNSILAFQLYVCCILSFSASSLKGFEPEFPPLGI